MAQDPREGGRIWNWFYKVAAGPASVANAVEGCSPEAREQWRRDLERRKAYTRDQRAKREAARAR